MAFYRKPTIHKMPLADYIEHEPADDCVCGPIFTISNEGRLATHPSLDGREKRQHGTAPAGSAED